MAAKNLKDLCLEEEEKTRIQKLDEIQGLEFNVSKTMPNALKLVGEEVASPAPEQMPGPSQDDPALSKRLKLIEEKLASLESGSKQKGEFLSEAKLLDFKITQVLQRMIKQNPANKKEAMMLKKLLSDFLKKTSDL